ncbi:MAG: hypothetical protein QF613_02810 [Candidatus Marinimicrobia bacterium]|nr:hypothetical protein [Candidatus Neomarinimicrobiota bacterium]
MKKIILLIIPLLSFSVSCENLINNDNNEDEVEIVFNLEPRLTVDSNGYYHLPLTEGSWQTLHRISGHIYEDGLPVDVVRFTWTSSHYWILGDTLGYIVNRGLTDQMVYVSVDTSYIIGFKGFEVPTINCCSYSNAEGEVNTMFAPVWSMRHDTVTVWVGFYDNEGQIQENTIEIVLNFSK